MYIQKIIEEQSFQAKVKLNKADLGVFAKKSAQSAIGATAFASGAGTVAAGAGSIAAEAAASSNTDSSIFHSAEDENIKSMMEGSVYVLESDNNGRGVPVQSTVLPPILVGAGFVPMSAASNAFKKVIGKENVEAVDAASKKSVTQTSNSLSNFSVKPQVQKSSAFSALYATAAGSIYSGFNADEVNQLLPHSIQSEPGYSPDDYVDVYDAERTYVGDSSSSIGISGGFLATAPISGSISESPSAKFVGNTLGKGEDKRKIPS